MKRILIVAGGAAGLLIAVLVGLSLFSGGGTSVDKLVSIVQQQAELKRVAELGVEQTTSTDAKNLASTVKLTMTSAQTDLTGLISKQGRKLSSKELAAGQDATTDAALTAAAQANRFDEVFTEEIQTQLLAYRGALSAAFQEAGSDTTRQTLQTLYAQVNVLVDSQD